MRLVTAALFAGILSQSPAGVQALWQLEVLHQADGGYSEEQARVYVADGGTVTYWPKLYPGDVIVSARSVGVCASALMCYPPDGGLDTVSVKPFPCACSTGASCNLSDAGAAPHGVTLPSGGYSGAGCQLKSCTALFLKLPDGGQDGTWPGVCPLQ